MNLLYDHLSVNEKGHLAIGGMDTLELAREFGTPAYIMDENAIRAQMRTYLNAAHTYFGADALPLYASKALCFTGIYRIAAEEGMGTQIFDFKPVVAVVESYKICQISFSTLDIRWNGTVCTKDTAIGCNRGDFVGLISTIVQCYGVRINPEYFIFMSPTDFCGAVAFGIYRTARPGILNFFFRIPNILNSQIFRLVDHLHANIFVARPQLAIDFLVVYIVINGGRISELILGFKVELFTFPEKIAAGDFAAAIERFVKDLNRPLDSIPPFKNTYRSAGLGIVKGNTSVGIDFAADLNIDQFAFGPEIVADSTMFRVFAVVY